MSNNTLRTGDELHALMARLFPINRSLTGDGVKTTLSILKEYLPDLNIREAISGSKVFDWQVPAQHNVKEAYIKHIETGEVFCDFSKNALNLIGYSPPIRETMNLEELRPHLHYLPDQPKLVPYLTSYYKPYFGFSLSYEDYVKLKEGEYEVVIDSEINKQGKMTYADLVIPGKSNKEILYSSYICHPAQANDGLSGIVVLVALAQYVASKPRRYTYRFLLAPETIGSITYLASSYRHGYMVNHLKKNLVAGWVMTCLGGSGDFTLQLSRELNLAEAISKHVLLNLGMGFRHRNWKDRASDERQFGAPNVDLPVVSVRKTSPHEFKEYHTSADNLEFVKPKELETSFAVYRKIVDSLELNKTYRTTVLGEPFMSKYDLYPTLSQKGSSNEVRDLMNLWSYCDGKLSTVEIANILDMSIWQMEPLINTLVKNELIYETN